MKRRLFQERELSRASRKRRSEGGGSRAELSRYRAHRGRTSAEGVERPEMVAGRGYAFGPAAAAGVRPFGICPRAAPEGRTRSLCARVLAEPDGAGRAGGLRSPTEAWSMGVAQARFTGGDRRRCRARESLGRRAGEEDSDGDAGLETGVSRKASWRTPQHFWARRFEILKSQSNSSCR